MPISKTLKSEIEAAIIIVLLGIALFFLPNHSIDPWNLFNPQKLGIIFLLIASMQFVAYFAIQLFGHKLGMALIGLFGGFVSSTVVFLTLSKTYQKQSAFLYPTISAAILATLGMLIEFLIILFGFSVDLFSVFFYPISGMIIISIVSTLMLTRGKDEGWLGLEKMSPLDLKSSLKLALWLFSILILITLSIRYQGAHSGALISFLAGLFELHGISITISTLYIQEKISLQDAKYLLSLALFAAFISKIAIVCFFSRNRFALFMSLYISTLLILGLLFYEI